ncbi:MAG TPA: ATP-binding cassette domain-containing protein [Puia sp.]|jgi:ABC-type multidrug transport system ATPase subunit|nr:ATP-binding cassette domain-containing protein [Puia sp.]
MNHALEFDSIRLSFNGRIILSDIYMKCETGKVTGLLGRNGQGKSCLFNIVYGERKVEESSVRFDKKSVPNAYTRPDLLLFLPQFDFFPRSLTVARVFEDFQVDFSEVEKRFPEFANRHKFKLKELSGGQFRFLQTYIILKARSQFAILDEPFTHLMPLQIEKIIEVIKEEKENKGLLITDHLYQEIIDLSDNLYLLKDGKTHRIKDPSEVEELGYALMSR